MEDTPNMEDVECQTCVEETTSTKNIESQTCNKVESLFIKKLQKEIKLSKSKLGSTVLNPESRKEDAEKFYSYTGVSYEQVFSCFMGTLGTFKLFFIATLAKKYKKESSS